jgi:hypothetical protein
MLHSQSKLTNQRGENKKILHEKETLKEKDNKLHV